MSRSRKYPTAKRSLDRPAGRPLQEGRSRRAGVTLIEVTIAMVLVTVAASMIATTLVSSARQKTVNRERAIATEGIRSVLERMRNERFDRIFALYNQEPFDDPNGPGTAPGSLFVIDDLAPLASAGGPTIGEIAFPVVNTGGAIDTNWELREDVEDAVLGTPRDLNGDSVVDDGDHAGDYRLLPVCVTARWQSSLGPREIRLNTLLADWSAQ